MSQLVILYITQKYETLLRWC